MSFVSGMGMAVAGLLEWLLCRSRDVAVKLRIPKPHTSGPKQALSGCGGVFRPSPIPSQLVQMGSHVSGPELTSLSGLSEKHISVSGPCATPKCPVPCSHLPPSSLLPRTLQTLAIEQMSFSKFLNAHTFLIYPTTGP